MPGRKSDCALLLQYEVVTSPEKVFSELRERGVVTRDHLAALQPLPPKKFDVVFKSPELLRRFGPKLGDIHGCTSNYTGGVSMVTILYVDLGVDDKIVRRRLSEYGEVIVGRYCTYQGEPTVFNGTRQYHMRIQSNIPSVLRIGNRNAWVSYPGQKRTCARCGAEGHVAKDCSLVTCFKCLQVGHSIRDCPNVSKCTSCGETGHNFRLCPNSFANRASPSKAWASTSVPDDDEAPAPPPAEENIESPSVSKSSVPSVPVSSVSPSTSSTPQSPKPSASSPPSPPQSSPAPSGGTPADPLQTPVPPTPLPIKSCSRCGEASGPYPADSSCRECGARLGGDFSVVECVSCRGTNGPAQLVCATEACVASVSGAGSGVAGRRRRRSKRRQRSPDTSPEAGTKVARAGGGRDGPSSDESSSHEMEAQAGPPASVPGEEEPSPAGASEAAAPMIGSDELVRGEAAEGSPRGGGNSQEEPRDIQAEARRFVDTVPLPGGGGPAIACPAKG